MATVVIPWLGGCAHREAALEHVLGRYVSAGFDDVVVSPGAEPWAKAVPIRRVLERLDDELVVIADADVWTDGLESALRAVTCGVAEWAIPHRNIMRLSEGATREVLEGAELEPELVSRAGLAQLPYVGIAGGGVLVALRSTLLEAPPDPRFLGWGQEDESWGVALTTLAGAPWRGTANLWHLYHPPANRWTRRRGSHASWDLRKRYQGARGDPPQMRALLAEFA